MHFKVTYIRGNSVQHQILTGLSCNNCTCISSGTITSLSKTIKIINHA